MPMPIRSSDSNISRAWALLRDMAPFDSNGGGRVAPNSRRSPHERPPKVRREEPVRLLFLHAKVLHQRQHCTYHRQPNQYRHCRLVVMTEEAKDVIAVVKSETGSNGVANPAAQSQGSEEFLLRILHRPRCQ